MTMTPAVQICINCQQARPLSRFLPSSRAPGGRLTKCLECIRAEAQRVREASERRAEKRSLAAQNATRNVAAAAVNECTGEGERVPTR
jgi:hypothetical protein